MAEKKNSGCLKSENVIWIVAASLLTGFIAGVAFGIYKSGSLADPHQTAPPAAMQEAQRQAIAALMARTRENPGDLESWIELGHRYFDANQPVEAVEAYEKALAIEPDNADVWTDLGVMFRRGGKAKKALEAFDRAMNIDPTHEISRFNKGIVLYYDLKDVPGALAAWEALLAINPTIKSPTGEPLQQLVDHIKEKH